MNKKYFFFDIDGTLTDTQTHKVVSSALIALKELVNNGHFVAIATGRAHFKAVRVMKECGLHNMVCNGGGGLVINDKLVVNIPLDNNKAKALIKEAEAKSIGILLMLDDSDKCYSKNDLFIRQVGKRSEPTEYIFDSTLDYDNLNEIFKIYLSLSKEDETQLCLINTLGNLRFTPEYLMFQFDEKHKGIENMMKHLKADVKDVVVFGDDMNDLVMFDKRWISIAMGNAVDALKMKADYITDRNIDDGIYKACKHFEWI